MEKPHEKIFDEIRHFVKAKFTELEAMEIPSEYFEETVDEIDHDLYTLGEEINYWAENRKADRSRVKIIPVGCEWLRQNKRRWPDEMPGDFYIGEHYEGLLKEVLENVDSGWPQGTYSESFTTAIQTTQKLAEDKWLKSFEEVLDNVDSNKE